MVLKEEGGPNTGEGSRTRAGSPKKAKPNKIPQRGLGIAALEKLRREEQQRKIAATFATGDNTSSSNSGSTSGHCTAGVIFHSLKPQPSPAAPFLPVVNPSSSLRPCYIGNYALFRPPLDAGDGTAPLLWNSVQSESFMKPNLQLPPVSRWQQQTAPPEHQQHQEQQRYSLAMKDFLSPPLPSEAGATGFQMELPSNQSYLSMNPPPLRTEEQMLVSMKRPWPFHSPMITPAHNFDHGSPLIYGNELKRTALTREDASRLNHGGQIDLGMKVRAGGDDAELDGSFLSLGPSEQSPRRTVTLQQHYMWRLQSNQIDWPRLRKAQQLKAHCDGLIMLLENNGHLQKLPVHGGRCLSTTSWSCPIISLETNLAMQTDYPTGSKSEHVKAGSNMKTTTYF